MKPLSILIASALPFLAACAAPPSETKPQATVTKASYDLENTEITGILVKKSEGVMHLVSDGRKVRTYDIDLGFSPKGDKKVQGDGKTPEGTYYINRKNPQSRFYRSIGISYPNEFDRAEARALGKNPGGDIFIHGQGRLGQGKSGTDWTWGCIAVTDIEAQEIFALVDVGTPVTILP